MGVALLGGFGLLNTDKGKDKDNKKEGKDKPVVGQLTVRKLEDLSEFPEKVSTCLRPISTFSTSAQCIHFHTSFVG